MLEDSNASEFRASWHPRFYSMTYELSAMSCLPATGCLLTSETFEL